MTDRTVLRWGSWAAIGGGVLALVMNILHPRPERFDDFAAEEVRIIGETEAWVPIHLGIVLAALLITFGLFALARSLKEGPAEGIARVALGSLMVSAPIALIGFLLDGYAMHAAAESVTADPAQTAIATAVGHVAWAAFMGILLTFLGITPLLFGWAAATDGRYPVWMGWVAVVVALVSIGAGVMGLLDGPSQAFFLAFSISSGLLTLWVIALGFLLQRRATGPITVPDGAASRTATAGRP